MVSSLPAAEAERESPVQRCVPEDQASQTVKVAPSRLHLTNSRTRRPGRGAHRAIDETGATGRGLRRRWRAVRSRVNCGPLSHANRRFEFAPRSSRAHSCRIELVNCADHDEDALVTGVRYHDGHSDFAQVVTEASGLLGAA